MKKIEEELNENYDIMEILDIIENMEDNKPISPNKRYTKSLEKYKTIVNNYKNMFDDKE